MQGMICSLKGLKLLIVFYKKRNFISEPLIVKLVRLNTGVWADPLRCFQVMPNMVPQIWQLEGMENQLMERQ